jgi:hypothetical protein
MTSALRAVLLAALAAACNESGGLRLADAAAPLDATAPAFDGPTTDTLTPPGWWLPDGGASCAGCWQDGVCVGGTEMEACGTGGGACQRCQASFDLCTTTRCEHGCLGELTGAAPGCPPCGGDHQPCCARSTCAAGLRCGDLFQEDLVTTLCLPPPASDAGATDAAACVYDNGIAPADGGPPTSDCISLGCAPGFACVSASWRIDELSNGTHCWPIPRECHGVPSCACMAGCACRGPQFSQCYDRSGYLDCSYGGL